MRSLACLFAVCVFCACAVCPAFAQNMGVTFKTENANVTGVIIDSSEWWNEAIFDYPRDLLPGTDLAPAEARFLASSIHGYVIVGLQVEDPTDECGWRVILARFRVDGYFDQETFRIIVGSDDVKLKMYLESGGFAPNTVWVYPDDHVPLPPVSPDIPTDLADMSGPQAASQ
ncbi:MAG: hypothetical protein Q8Q20_04090 [bacterium]|nr:hypothetical protein [bacterium]